MSQTGPTDNTPLSTPMQEAEAQEPEVQEFEVPEIAETQELMEAPEEPEAQAALEPVAVDPNRPARRRKS